MQTDQIMLVVDELIALEDCTDNEAKNRRFAELHLTHTESDWFTIIDEYRNKKDNPFE